jgi:hypothetical protein
MGASFTPVSLITLARWTRYLGYVLLLLFSISGIRYIAVLWTAHKLGGVVLIWYGLFFLVPGITMLIIPRWIEDGRVWAFALVSVISVLLPMIMFLNVIVTCVFSFGLMLLSVRVLAAVLNAWPDMRDMARDRRRRYQSHGFEPLMQTQSPQALSPIPARPLQEADAGLPPLPVSGFGNSAPSSSPVYDGPALPRFVPDSLIQTSRAIRTLGGLMLIALIIILALCVSGGTENRYQINWPAVIGLHAVVFLVPGVMCLWLGGWIEIGRRWAVITVAATCAAVILMGWVFVGLTFQSDVAATGAAALFPVVLSSAFCGLALVFCLYVRRDIRDVSRSMKRDRLTEMRGIRR